MERVPLVYRLHRMVGSPAIFILDVDAITINESAKAVWLTTPPLEVFYAIEKLAAKGDFVVLFSYRRLDEIQQAFALCRHEMPIIYEDGKGIFIPGDGHDRRPRTISRYEPEPGWITDTVDRLGLELPNAADTKLVAGDHSVSFHIRNTHTSYDYSEACFLLETQDLNGEGLGAKFMHSAHRNGHIIQCINDAGPAMGIQDFLQDVLCVQYECTLEELFNKYFCCIIFACAGVTATRAPALEYIKKLTRENLSIGHSYLIAPDQSTAWMGDFATSIVANASAMIGVLQQTVTFEPSA
jgi:hypothetical protein